MQSTHSNKGENILSRPTVLLGAKRFSLELTLFTDGKERGLFEPVLF